MAKRSRVEIRALSGRSHFETADVADKLFAEHKIAWTDHTRLYAYHVAAPTAGGDYSKTFTKRSNWIPLQSGWAGPTVMQLV